MRRPPAFLALAVLSALSALCAACARPAPWPAPAASPPRDGAYRYHVTVGPRAEEIVVEVDLPAGPAEARVWTAPAAFRPFVRDVGISAGAGFTPVRATEGGFLVPACAAPSCRVRYRVRLAEAAAALDELDLAVEHRGVFLSPPSSWLVRPSVTRGPFLLDVTAAAGAAFVTGLARDPASPRYTGDVAALDDTPYAAFGPLAIRTLDLPGGALDVAYAPAGDFPARAAVDRWIDANARAVAAYFQRFPIAHAALIVERVPGDRVGGGRTMGRGGGSIVLRVGESTGERALAGDWVLVHEMVHLSFPDVDRPWAEEGLATYLEPILRARAGLLPEGEVWRQLVEGLPQGQPGPGDGGLDHTDTWGRRYWGGAFFWLLADLEIRQRTDNRRSLDDALRAVQRAAGGVAARWDLDHALAVGDEATGVPVLRPLRRRLGDAPEVIDLAALWRRLGVVPTPGGVTYDDGAPLAALRRAITARTP